MNVRWTTADVVRRTGVRRSVDTLTPAFIGTPRDSSVNALNASIPMHVTRTSQENLKYDPYNLCRRVRKFHGRIPHIGTRRCSNEKKSRGRVSPGAGRASNEWNDQHRRYLYGHVRSRTVGCERR